MKSKIILLSLVLVAIVLVSGCSQQQPKETPTKTPIQTPTNTQSTATPTPSPTQVSAAGDVLGSELAKSDSGESDLTDTDLDNLNSDLGEVERGL